jgi:hypothetical protein
MKGSRPASDAKKIRNGSAVVQRCSIPRIVKLFKILKGHVHAKSILSPALRMEMNRRLVLSEANLFHLQTRRNAKPAESWKPCIVALELIQTLHVAASFRRASQFCPVLLSIVHNPGLFNAPRARYTRNDRVSTSFVTRFPST